MTVDIGVDAVINRIRLKEQASMGETPASGYGFLYIKADGVYFKDDGGVEVGPFSTGGGGRTLIDSASPSGTGTVTFSSIPGTYQSLEILYVGRSTKAASNNEDVAIEFNTDTTATNYRYTQSGALGTGSSTLSGASSNYITQLPAASAPTNSSSGGRIFIPYYADTTFKKELQSLQSYRYDTTSLHEVIFMRGMEWANTSAITRIDIKLASGNYVAGTKFRLYGID